MIPLTDAKLAETCYLSEVSHIIAAAIRKQGGEK